MISETNLMKKFHRALLLDTEGNHAAAPGSRSVLIKRFSDLKLDIDRRICRRVSGIRRVHLDFFQPQRCQNRVIKIGRAFEVTGPNRRISDHRFSPLS